MTNMDLNFHDVHKIKIKAVRRLSISNYQILEIEVFDANGNNIGKFNFYSNEGEPLIVEQIPMPETEAA